MKDLSNKRIWITGASSGIGEALAYELAKFNTHLILSSRRENELERVKSKCEGAASVTIVPLDLSIQEDIEKAADKVLAELGTVDILINNGGISQRGLTAETDISVDRKIMEVDYFSGVILTKKLLPAMLAQKSGHIVAISSIVGVFGFPLRSAYSAAKHAIHGFYESLWAENHKDGIDVTVACPGRILTNVSLHALIGNGQEHGEMDHAQANGITAEKCAKKIVKAIRKRKKEVFICRKDILMVYFRRWFPWLYYTLVSKVKPT